MNNIKIQNAVIKDIRRFSARGGHGVDITIQDNIGAGTAYFQLTYYDAQADRFLSQFQIGDRLNVEGQLRTIVYKTKDGRDTISNVIEKPSISRYYPQKTTREPALPYPHYELADAPPEPSLFVEPTPAEDDDLPF